ncbi:MAG: SAM-binding motif [Rhodanobacter sp. SCN 68-63]|nr:MAG: SAM-binding motif [Rhodanobacter sp. SCN 68-63]
MNKQPKLVLRESCVDDVSATWRPGRFVEMGAGTGHMAERFLRKGFEGTCHDLSEVSRSMMRRRFRDLGLGEVVDSLGGLEPEGADYLLAFEVLEHIENDREVLKQWLHYLRPGGRILVSVPAHQRKFGRSDELVGHVRRYERAQLKDLLSDAGLVDVELFNYGFPVTELTRRLSNRIVLGDKSYDTMTPVERSMLSAQAKPRRISRILSVVSGRVVSPFCAIQRMFYRWDLGDGLVASAVKPASARPGSGLAVQAGQ